MISKSTFYLKCVIFYLEAGPSHAYVLSHVWIFATPWMVARQAALSMGCSRQEYRGELPFPPPGIFPTQGWNPRPLCIWHKHRFFTTSAALDPIQAGEGSQFWGEKNQVQKALGEDNKPTESIQCKYLNIACICAPFSHLLHKYLGEEFLAHSRIVHLTLQRILQRVSQGRLPVTVSQRMY